MCGFPALFVRAGLQTTISEKFAGALNDLQVGLIADDEPGLQNWLVDNQAAAILVRPDGYVLASAASVDEIADLLKHEPGL